MPLLQSRFTSIKDYYKNHRDRTITQVGSVADFKNAQVFLYNETDTNNHWIFILPQKETTLKTLLEDLQTKTDINTKLTIPNPDDKNTFIVFLSLDIGTGFDTEPYLENETKKEAFFEKIQTQADMIFCKFKLDLFAENEKPKEEEKSDIDKFMPVNFINEVIPWYFV